MSWPCCPTSCWELFTGKTQSLRFGDNLLPIASIVAGLFVRNPLLKMLLVGLGGANLLNKAGHEALGRPMPSADVHTEKPVPPLSRRTAQFPYRKPCTARQHAHRHDRPCALYHPAHADRRGGLPCRGIAAEHAGERRACQERPVAPYCLAELRRRTAGDDCAHTGHPINP